MRSNRHFVPSLLALLCVPGRFAPAQAKVTPRDADVGSLGSRVTAVEGDVADAQSDINSLESADTAIDSRLDSAEENLTAVSNSVIGTGFDMDYGPADKTGSGSAAEQNITIPAPITLTDGHAYTINGTIKASKPTGDGGALLYSAEIKGFRLARDSGAWVTTPLARGNLSLTEDLHADIASYFASLGDRPVFGVTSSNITLNWTAVNTMHFTLELDGDIADDGVYTP